MGGSKKTQRRRAEPAQAPTEPAPLVSHIILLALDLFCPSQKHFSIYLLFIKHPGHYFKARLPPPGKGVTLPLMLCEVFKEAFFSLAKQKARNLARTVWMVFIYNQPMLERLHGLIL